MATIDAKVIQELLDQINALKKTIETAGDVGRTKLKDIKVDEVRQTITLTADGKLDTANWDQRGQDEQNELCERLVLVRDSLHVVAGLEGPTDPKHIMYVEYASNIAIIMWALTGFLLTALLLYGILMRWSQATGTDFALKIQAATGALRELDEARDRATKANAAETEARRKAASATDEKIRQEAQQTAEVQARTAATQGATVEEAEKKASLAAVKAIQEIQKSGATESSVLAMIILLGALGGSLHLVASLVKYVGNRQLRRSWLLHYLSMPIVGAGLAPIVYMLLRVGILAPSGVPTDGSSTANLNLNAIYAFAALTGLFAKTATEKLGEVFGTIFRTEEPPSKDALGSERPPGGAAPTGGKSS